MPRPQKGLRRRTVETYCENCGVGLLYADASDEFSDVDVCKDKPACESRIAAAAFLAQSGGAPGREWSPVEYIPLTDALK
jgi:hypothetical protein